MVAEEHRKRLLPYLSKFRRPAAPAFPYVFNNMSEGEIIEAVKDAKKALRAAVMTKSKFSETDNKILEKFGAWRGGVIMHELKAEGNIVAILRAARTFMLADDENVAYMLLTFVEQEYNFAVDPPTPPMDHAEINRLAKRFSKRPDLMSDNLILEGEEELSRQFMKDVEEPEQLDMMGVF